MYKYNKLFFINKEKGNIKIANIEKSFTEIVPNTELSGIKFSLKGRLKGAKRARKLSIAKGAIKAQTYDFFAPTFLSSIQTKWGKQGLSVTLGYY